MTRARIDVGTTEAESSRIGDVRRVATAGGASLSTLLAMRTDPSWAVRREVIVALGELGDAAVAPLCESLRTERDDETRIAATVDALVASTGAVDAQLITGSVGSDPAVLADVAQILGRRRSPTSVLALADLARNPDDNVAVAAIEGLGKIGGRAVVDTLVESVQSRSFFRTFAAIDVLGKSGDPRAVAPLAALLGDVGYAFEAARALGRTCDRAATAPLASLLTSPVDSLVRVAAVALADLRQKYGQRFGSTTPVDDAIRGSGRKSVTRRLVQCTSGADIDEHVAINIVLGCLGDEAATPALVRALDGPVAVASAAAEALERLSSDSEQQLVMALSGGNSAKRQMLLPRMRSARATDAAIACLSDADATVRRLACEALARIGSPQALEHLFKVLEDGSPVVVQAATSAIVSLGHQDTPALALTAASSPNPVVRRAALRILSHLGSLAALRVLEGAVHDPNARIREAAITGLAAFELPEATTLLLALTTDASAPIRALAIRTLGEAAWRTDGVGERLAVGLKDPDAWVRYYACQALGKLRSVAHVEAVAEHLADPAGQVRVAAIEALSHMPTESAFAALLAAAAPHEELDLRRAALIGLGMANRREGLGVLLENANADDAATRLIALSALANSSSPETLSALTRATRDPDESVRMAAIGFLGARPGVDATEVLTRLLTDAVLGERALAALSVPNVHRVVGLSSALQTADDELAVLLTGLLARANLPDATAALFEAVTLPNVAARRAAATTLGALRSREALATLQRLSIEDADPEVRRVCALILAQ